MTFDNILMVLAGVIPMFIVMILMGSSKRLMTFVALLFSIATIISISAVRKAPNANELLWVPIVLTMFTYMLYSGDGYTNPKIQENLYRVVKVERRWTSVFSEDDDYEIYVEPVTIGGFVENTFFSGIIFCFFYAVFGLSANDWIAYIPSIYFLGMSIIEVLITLGAMIGVLSDFPTLIYWIWRILVIIAALVIGFSGQTLFAPSIAGKYNKLYEQCKDYTVLDYSTTYVASYNYGSFGHYDPTYFLYDSDLNVAGFYKDFYGEKRCLYVFAKDPRLAEDSIAKFQNVGVAELTFVFERYAQETDNPFKFEPNGALNDLGSYAELTKQKMLNLTQVKKYEDEKLLSILYASRNDNSPEKTTNDDYQIKYNFNTDKKGNPTSLAYFEFEQYFNNGMVKTFTYEPFYEDTGFADLFDENANLKAYDTTTQTISKRQRVLDAVNTTMTSLKQSLESYDFCLRYKITAKNALFSQLLLAYDPETQASAVYYEEQFLDGENAVANNDFVTYKPHYYVSNVTRSLYNSNYDLIQTTDNFTKYTYYTGTASDIIRETFQIDMNFVYWDYEDIGNNAVKATVTAENYGLKSGERFEINYVLYLLPSRTGYTVSRVDTEFTFREYVDYIEGINYLNTEVSFSVYMDDAFDVPAPKG